MRPIYCALLMLSFAASASAATATSYDGTFTLSLPKGYVATAKSSFAKVAAANMPVLCVQSSVVKPGAGPLLVLHAVAGTDAGAVSAKDLADFKTRVATSKDYAPGALQQAPLAAGATGYWFSNGAQHDYSLIYFSVGGRVIRGVCASTNRALCLSIVGTAKAVKTK